MVDPPKDLCDFVDASPSPYHAVAQMARRLEEAGFRGLDERAAWELGAGDERYVVRDGGSIVAFRVGTQAPSQAGLRLVGAHTDSPTLQLRPRPSTHRVGYRLLAVEPYGGPLLYTWLDRDLTIAGRVAVRERDGVALHRVHLPGAPLRVPSLAIHLQRELARDGLRLDPQRHVQPLWGRINGTERALGAVLAEHVGAAAGDVLAFDLFTVDTQPSGTAGADDAWVVAPRLDNLASCHAGLDALLQADPGASTQLLVCNDHEEVGSGSAEGARGSFLADTVERLVGAVEPEPQALRRALAGSLLVSADAAHAQHPNWAEKHDASHTPVLGGGPVVKVNAGQSYASDAGTAADFVLRCREAGVDVQHFVSRADLPCGSTIGPLTATRLGVATVDVGLPLLSMHSCREQIAGADVGPFGDALRAHFSAAPPGPRT